MVKVLAAGDRFILPEILLEALARHVPDAETTVIKGDWPLSPFARIGEVSEAEGDEDPVLIERNDAGPREAARSNRQRRPSRSGNDSGYVKVKPVGRAFAKPEGGKPRPGKPAANRHKHKRKFKPG